MAYIFFDIDGTMMSADPELFPQVKPAWDRLKAGIEMTSLQCLASSNPELVAIGKKLTLPTDFNWKEHTGETDLGVIINIAKNLGIGREEITTFNIPSLIMDNMYRYYSEKMKEVRVFQPTTFVKFSSLGWYDFLKGNYLPKLPDISQIPLFFPVYKDVWTTLFTLKSRGHKLGIVTGNARDVTKAKLQLSGLSLFFDDETLWFIGDMAETRAELLLNAFFTMYKNEGEFPQLNYVGDAIKDITAVQELRAGILSQFSSNKVGISRMIPINVFIRYPEHSLVRLPAITENDTVHYEPGCGYLTEISEHNTHLHYFHKLNDVISKLGLSLSPYSQL